jgi:hypothetical protein
MRSDANTDSEQECDFGKWGLRDRADVTTREFFVLDLMSDQIAPTLRAATCLGSSSHAMSMAIIRAAASSVWRSIVGLSSVRYWAFSTG